MGHHKFAVNYIQNSCVQSLAYFEYMGNFYSLIASWSSKKMKQSEVGFGQILRAS